MGAVDEGVKACTWCGETKPLDRFGLNRDGKDGRRSKCRNCVTVENAVRRGSATVHVRAIEANTRAKRAGAYVRPVTAEHITGRFAMFGNRCWMCGAQPTTMMQLQIEHVKPLDAGGKHIPANIRPACVVCNGEKAAKWIRAVTVKDILESFKRSA